MKRFLSLLLALAMIATMLPQIAVFATEEQPVQPVAPEQPTYQGDLPQLPYGWLSVEQSTEEVKDYAYVYIPEGDGIYVFAADSSALDTEATILDPQGRELAFDTDGSGGKNFRLRVYLREGQVYTLKIRAEGIGSFGISTELEVGVNPIEIGTHEEVQVNAGTISYCVFTAPEAGIYLFRSDSELDSYGYLYSEDMEELTHDDDSGGNSNFLISREMEAGETVVLGVRFYNSEYHGSVGLSVAPFGVQSVTCENLVMPEYSSGYMTEGSNGQFFYYEWLQKLTYTITYRDGSEQTFTGSEFQVDGSQFYVSGEDSQYNNHWEAGNTYEVTVNFAGISVPAQITIAKSPVVSVEAEPLEIYQHTWGHYEYYRDPETGAEHRDEFVYAWQDFITYTVTFENGHVETFTGRYFSYNGTEYQITTTAWQDGDDEWQLGAHTAEFYVLGCKATANVTIVSSPVSNVSVNDVVIAQNTYGWTDNFWSEELGYVDYYRYNWHDWVSYTVTLKNGKTYEGSGDYINIDGVRYDVFFEDDQGGMQPWDVGTHTGVLDVLGCSVPVNVTISESAISSVEILPIRLTEGTSGDNFQQENGSYFHYRWWMPMQYKVTMLDGQVLEGTGSAFLYQGKYYTFEHTDDQSLETPWTAGNTYYPTVTLMGQQVPVSVEIAESPVASVVLDPLTITENTGGSYQDSEQGRYYQYYWWNEMQGTVYFKNGDVSTFSGNGFWYNGIYYSFDIYDDQNGENPWVQGNTYSGNVQFGGISTYVAVTIRQNPVSSLTVDPIVIMEETNGFRSDGPEGSYYYYQWWNLLSFTVNFADGTSAHFTGLDCYHNGVEYDVGSSDNQTYENRWQAGNTYYGGISLSGHYVSVPVTIVGSEVVNIVPKPLSIPAGTCGQLVRDKNGSEIFFRYDWGKYISYTVYFADGNALEVTGESFAYNGITYTPEFIDDQRGANQWMEGNQYYASISVPGCGVEATVTISEAAPSELDYPQMYLGSNNTLITQQGGLGIFRFTPEETGLYTFISEAGYDTYGYLLDRRLNVLQTNDDGYINNQFKLEASLTAGETYVIVARYYSNEYTGNICVDVSKQLGVSHIEFTPVELYSGVGGEYITDEYGENGYYRYYWWDNLQYTVYMENGEVGTFSDRSFMMGGCYYELTFDDPQSFQNAWVEGGTYEVLISVSGKQFVVPVSVQGSGIQNVTFHPVTVLQEATGYYNMRWNDQTQQQEQYFQYYWWDAVDYEITMENGDVVSGRGSGYSYQGRYYSFERPDDGQYITSWNPGSTHYPQLGLGGNYYEVPVYVQPVHVQSIYVEPVVQMEHTNGYWADSYSGSFYHYNWWNQMKWIITYENGSTYAGSGASFYMNDVWNNVHVNNDQSYENQYVVGGTYNVPVKIFGVEAMVQVTITDTVGGQAGDNVVWTLDGEGNFVLSGTGEMYAYSGSSNMAWDAYKDKINTVTIGEGITSLGNFAFYSCPNLTRVSFSSTVVDTGIYTFYSCIGLETVELGSNVQRVGEYTFAYCTNLKEVTIPATVTELGEWAFYPCSDLQKVYYQGTQMAWSKIIHNGYNGSLDNAEKIFLGVAEIVAEGVTGNLTWKFDTDGLLTVSGDGAMPDYSAENPAPWADHMESICKVIFEGEIPEIGSYAFYGAKQLKDVEMQCSLRRIGDYAFFGCESIIEFYMYEIDIVGSHAFEGCSSIYFIGLGNSWTSIGDYAFADCGVEEVEYTGPGYRFYQENIGMGNEPLLEAHLYSVEEEGVVLSGRCGDNVYWIHYETGELKVFGEGAIYDYNNRSKPWERFGYPVYTITIEEGITYIGDTAFGNCGDARELTIPGTVKYIANCAFINLANVKVVNIPEGVEVIDSNAFAFSGMDQLSLPDSLKVIGWEAFRQCDCLTEIYIPKGVETIDGNAFMACHALDAIRVDAENQYFSSDDRGVLYNKDKTVLICAPGFISGSFTVPETVQRIEDYAFAHCTNLEEVIMGDNVTEMGYFVFNGCYALRSVVLGKGITKLSAGMFMEAGLSEFVIPAGITVIERHAFQGCEHLTSVTIPNTVEIIEENAFAYCMSLTTAEIPASVKSLGQNVFQGCYMLSQVGIAEGVTSIGEFAFADCTELTTVTIPESVETVGAYAFIGCTNLTDVTIGKNVTAIGDSAFEGCVNLKEVSVPQGVTEYVYRMFAGCTSLETVNIPDTVKSIGEQTFADCNALTEVKIPDSVEYVGDYAFKQCENLSVIHFGKGVSQLGSNVFVSCNSLTAFRVHQDNAVYASDEPGVLFDKSMVTLLRAPVRISGNYTVPDGTVEIADGAFGGCSELNAVSIPGSVEYIGNDAFNGCWSLCQVELAEGIIHIGDFAFACCSALEEIHIPSTVEYLGCNCFVDNVALKRVTLADGFREIQPYTFGWCYALESVRIPKSVTAIYEAAFVGCNNLREVVYGGSAQDWMNINVVPWDNQALENAIFIYEGDNEVLDAGSCGENVQWSLTVGGALTVFGEGAMANYGGLNGETPWAQYTKEIKTLEIQEGVTYVGDAAFDGCINLVSVTIAGTVTELSSRAFAGCENLVSVSLSNGLVTIGTAAFTHCYSLSAVELPETLVNIGDQAFAACSCLREFYIPANVKYIVGDPFGNCDQLEGIYVHEENRYFANDNFGVLYNKDMTQLLRVPCALSGGYNVLDCVTTIGDYAFFCCDRISSLSLPESLETVGLSAFDNANCIVEVYYAGSEVTWNNISFGENNQCLFAANIHFGRQEDLGAGTFGDGLTWVLTFDGTLVISGNSWMPDFADPTEAPWYALREQIVTLVIEEGVTMIGAYAFYDCDNLRVLDIAYTVCCIEVYAFYSCDSITEFSMPANLSKICDSAFEGCSSLTYVYGNNGQLGTIQARVFKDCYNLTVFPFAYGLYGWGEQAFANTGLRSVIVPSSVQYIGEYAFDGSKLTEATIEDGQLTELNKGIFANCNDLVAVNLGNNITALGSYMFENCTSLTNVIMSGCLTTIGGGCFKNCDSLQSITIPEGVTAIYAETFYDCDVLRYVYIGSNVELVSDYAFYGTAISEMDFNNSLVTIGAAAFASSDLIALYGIENVTAMGESAFEDCHQLRSFTIPVGVSEIKNNTFARCWNLEELTLSNTVQFIGINAFLDSWALQNVHFNGTKKQFEAITMDGGNDVLFSAELHCSEKPENVYVCVHCGEEVEWQTWNGTATSGHFRLTEDYSGTQAMVGSTSVSGVETVIDLNGHILSSDKRAFTVYSGNNLTVLDTAGGGVIMGGYTSAIGGAVLVTGHGASFYLLGGTVTSQSTNSGGCVYVSDQGYFHMGGGQLVGAALSSGRRGGAIYVAETASVNLYKGVITDGIARGASIYAANNANLHIGSVNVGEVLAANMAYIYLYDMPVVEAMDLTSGAKLHWEELHRGTRITVYADDVFANYHYEAEAYIPYFISGFENSVIVAEDNFLKVSYPDEQQVIDVTVLEMPNKWQYEQGEELDLTGLQLLVYYSNGNEEVVEEGFAAYGFDSFTPGAKTVYVCYGDYETYFNVIVNEKRVVKVDLHTYPFKTEYFIGETFESSGVELHVFYSNGDEAYISEGIDFAYPSFDAAGEFTVEASFDGFTVTFPVTVKARAVEITKQPESVTVQEGEKAVFQVVANNVVYYHWHVDANNGLGWQAVSQPDWDTDTLTVAAELFRSGYRYRCALTDAAGNVTHTDAVTLNIIPNVVNQIVLQPVDTTADSGNVATFTVGAEGNVASYQWQYKKGSGDWINTALTGYNTDTLSVAANATRNGYLYRCAVTFTDGTVLYSESAVLTVITQITIVDNPNDQVVVLGYKGQFSVEAKGEGLKFQWQYKRPNLNRWMDTSMEGANKATVYVETTRERDGYQYRCMITDATGVVVYSEPATMTVLSYTSQPQDARSSVNGTVQFKVVASTDSGFTYQWQYRRNENSAWMDTSMTGCKTNTLTVQATKARNGYQYRCVLTGAKNSKLESKAVTLYVSEPVVISAQPQSVTVKSSENAVFTVEATNVLSYQWMYSRNGSQWFDTSATGNQTDTLTVAAKNKNGYRYRCRIMGMDGQEYMTEIVMLTIG